MSTLFFIALQLDALEALCHTKGVWVPLSSCRL